MQDWRACENACPALNYKVQLIAHIQPCLIIVNMLIYETQHRQWDNSYLWFYCPVKGAKKKTLGTIETNCSYLTLHLENVNETIMKAYRH